MTQYLFNRRQMILSGAAAVLAHAAPAVAQAQPIGGPIRLVVGFPPGGTTDVLARVLAQKMRSSLDTEIIVENRPGASGMIAAESVARAPRDGRTLLVAVASLVQAPAVMPKLNFDPIKDLEPITSIARGSTVLVTSSNTQVNSVSDFVTLARTQPGKLSIGNYGQASSAHIQGSALAMQANIDVVQVSYRGAAPLATAVLGGEVTVAISDMATALPHVRAGKMKALAVSGSRVSPLFPQAPTLSSLGFKSVDMDGWIGIFTTAGVPVPVLAKLHEAAAKASESPEMKERIEAIGMRPDLTSHQEFSDMVRRDAREWSKVVAETKLQLNQ